MTHAKRMLAAFLTSLLWVACAHNEPAQRMMHERAAYADDAPEATDLNLASSAAVAGAGKLLPRPEPRVAEVWVYPQRLSNHEYFWGAWVSLRLEDEQWESGSITQHEPTRPSARPKNSWSTHKKSKR